MNEFDSEAGALRLVGGRLCLDFVNTVGGREALIPRRGSRRSGAGNVLREKLNTYTDLLAWGMHASIISRVEANQLLREAEKHAEEAAAILRRALVFREAIYGVFKALVDGFAPSRSDLDMLNVELSNARVHEKLVRTKDGFVFEWDNTENALNRVLWPIVTSVAEFLSAGELARLRECGGDKCGWLFEDASRNRSRQWCYMQGCGNLSKVRRFRKRVKGARGAK